MLPRSFTLFIQIECSNVERWWLSSVLRWYIYFLDTHICIYIYICIYIFICIYRSRLIYTMPFFACKILHILWEKLLLLNLTKLHKCKQKVTKVLSNALKIAQCKSNHMPFIIIHLEMKLEIIGPKIVKRVLNMYHVPCTMYHEIQAFIAIYVLFLG